MMFESFLKNGYLKIILSDIEKINYVFENDRSLFGDTKRYEIEKALTIPISFQYNIYEDYNLILDLSYQNIKKEFKLTLLKYLNLYLIMKMIKEGLRKVKILTL